MKHITFHIDFVSPYAWLAFERMPEVLEGLSYTVQYRPVLLGALLQRNANPGPAGIEAKREWTYRHVHWLGASLGVPLDMPAEHPFNPLPLLRLALQCSDDGSINRFVAGTLLRHVWQGGQSALDAQRLQELMQQLQGQLRSDDQATQRAKDFLRTNTEAAANAGVFGVPAWEVDGKIFWGLDGLPMLRSYLAQEPWFDAAHWESLPQTPSGLKA
ncbi:2-hydroxychromene-2-carboxylate isomerase [Comamonas endophytica]|uniref:2-hydroxychromene-2-carboxylate isomerase n=1 Tax=Comamonas endophytica TaxID=2949090 RepID=A0ABY6GD69_9BURK|nr:MULTISPECIES: DsbA family protein [unclassified Acidovorax]MCD2512787.1 DsbA family protein [Acidovorax sp. D4N7]UYG52863.1 DsbA family protein [Acidovorax sp. 5MLIR]